MTVSRAELEASIQAKIDADSSFSAEIASLSDDEKAQRIDQRKAEEFDKELKTLKEGSERASKAEELAGNYKTRAEKAEKELKSKPATEPSQQPKGLSQQDILVLAKADIHDDDLSEVTEFMQSKNLDARAALNHPMLKSYLATRGEERRTAAATQTRSARGGTSTVTGDKLLDKARTSGEVPESDEGIEQLVRAETDSKRRKT